MKDGKRCSGSIPYGYNRLPNDKQTLIVDPVASEVVKRIFLLANEGKSPRTIAELLTEEKVLIPAAYAKKYHPEQYNGTKFSNPYLWGTSSVRTILGRQEYLGHTVLRKSVSTNFKLHKRKETDEDEQYVFQNTHEPIISQELWDSVQKRRCRVNRASAWGTHTNRLSGYLYCADCGRRLTLQTHYSKKDGSTQYSYRCGGYASRVNGCTPHSISADNVESLILASVKRFSRFVLKDEETFALELQSLWKEKREEKPKQNQTELKRCQKRYDELSALIRSLYENLMAGLLPERQYKQLMAQYDGEQAELESKMETMKSEIAEDKSSSADAKETAERKNHLQDLQTQRNKAEKDLLALKTEVLACIKGESVLPRETLAEMITAQEEKLTELENLCEAASEELEKTAELMDKVSRLYDELISYADLYDSANFEAKKMIVNQLIRRVDVYRGYQINISFNFDLTPYIEGE